MKKQLVAIGAVTAISAAGMTGAAVANAATTPTTEANPMSNLVDAIASKFNLKKTDVQAVFDEQHTRMEVAREAEVKTQISQLVTDGKLTQAQADKINAKRAELEKQRETNRSTMQNMTQDQRQSEMQTHRTQIDTWLKDNGIDQQYAYLLMGGRGHGPEGMGRHGMRGEMMHRQSSSGATQSQ